MLNVTEALTRPHPIHNWRWHGYFSGYLRTRWTGLCPHGHEVRWENRMLMYGDADKTSTEYQVHCEDHLMDDGYVVTVLELWSWDKDELDQQDLMWTIDGDTVKFSLRVSDTFEPATADSEPILEEDLGALEEAIKECKERREPWNGPLLWAARKRGKRPLYGVSEAVDDLFDGLI